MKSNLYRTLARIELMRATLEHHEAFMESARAAGYTASMHDAGEEVLGEGLEAIHEVAAELQPDTTVHHLIHTAATEVEQWMEHALFKARSGEAEALTWLRGSDLHHADHTLTVIARAVRMQAFIRQDKALQRAIGEGRPVDDLLQRGNALMTKLARLTQGLVSPSVHAEEAAAIIGPAQQAAEAWLEAAEAATRKAFAAAPQRLGAVGVVGEDALPMGGSGQRIVRHQQSHREAPVPVHSPPDPGWSCGRQGRNVNNSGRGFH